MSDRDTGVELAHYLLDGRCCVRFSCMGCQMARDFPVQQVIDRLKARGLGGERTGIRAVARFVEKPCPRCNGFRFETTPGWGAAR